MNKDNIAALDQSIGHDGLFLYLRRTESTICSPASLCCFGRRRDKLQKMKKEGIQGSKRRANNFLPRHRLSFMNGQMSDNYYNCGRGRSSHLSLSLKLSLTLTYLNLDFNTTLY